MSHMAMKSPTVPTVMLAVMGVFEFTAAFACFLPSFVCAGSGKNDHLLSGNYDHI